MSGAQAVYLQVGPHVVPLWLHAAKAATPAALGVVMCPAWGREDAAAHAPWRDWAQALSDAGYPAIRLDYPGEGDASGRAETDANLDDWLTAVRAAADALMAQTGVQRVCLMGLRWGAAVAWQAAVAHPNVEAVLAVAPVVKGRQMVRELAALQAASSGDDPALTQLDCAQSGGHVLPQSELARWSMVDLAAQVRQQGVGGVRHVAVLDRADLPVADGWGQALSEAGVVLKLQRLDGAEAMLGEPHQASLPPAWLEASLAWLSALSGERALAAQAAPRVPEAALSTEALLTWCSGLGAAPEAGEALVERVLRLPGGGAVGVLSARPGAVASHSGRAVLLLNAGAIRHTGPNRMWVDWARDWAAAGHLVLRLDLCGLGESPTRAGRTSNQAYPHDAVADVAEAVAWLRRQAGVRRVLAGGLCAGGYHALTAVRRGVPIDQVLMINPLVYMNAEGLDLSGAAPPAEHKVHTAMAAYTRALRSPAAWRKVLLGQADLGMVARVVRRRLVGRCQSALRACSRWMGWRWHDDLGRDIAEAMDRQVTFHLLFSEGDPGLALLREELGQGMAKLSQRPGWHCEVLPPADHTFTRWSDRQVLTAKVAAILSAPA
ncbi:MAG: hypothetical protein RI907_1135 [Pseudomonadota bacterium]|jgi:dienelactone hydrolase